MRCRPPASVMGVFMELKQVSNKHWPYERENSKYTQVFINIPNILKFFWINQNILKGLIKSIPRSESGDKCL